MERTVDKTQQEIQELTNEWISQSQFSQEYVDKLVDKISAGLQ